MIIFFMTGTKKMRRINGMDFIMPERACENAMRDIPDLNEIEKDMIKCHMFPLNIVPPQYMEGWILCCADKICSGAETVKGRMPEKVILPWKKKEKVV